MTIEKAYDSFKNQTPAFRQFETQANLNAIREKAATYGPLDVVSSWAHAFVVLKATLTPIANYREPGAPIPAGFEALVTQQLRPDELRKRLNQEPDFAAFYERWAQGEKELGWQPPQPVRVERGGYHIQQHNVKG